MHGPQRVGGNVVGIDLWISAHPLRASRHHNLRPGVFLGRFGTNTD